MSEDPGRQCIFCDHTANSREHIFPDWINTIFPPGKIGPVDAIQVQVVTGQPEASTHHTYAANKLAQQTAKIVCCCCNGGWMSTMEGRARQLLEQSILGHATTFNLEEQIFIAGWAVKTAMLGETIMKYQDSFTEADRRLVRKEQRPPLPAMVFLAVYGGPNVGTAYFRSLGQVTKDGSPFTDLYVHTIQVGRLVLQVRGYPSLALSQNVALTRVSEPRYNEIPIFPPVESCRWPPKLVLDDDALGRYTAAGTEPPAPPPGVVLGLPQTPPDSAE